MHTSRPKIAIVGGGVAGLSLGAALGAQASVTVLEAEPRLYHHSSGRSAAAYIEPYINEEILKLSRASRDDLPLLPRGNLLIANEAQHDQVDAFLDRWQGLCPQLREVSSQAACDAVPILRPASVHRALIDLVAQDIDVPGMLAGFHQAIQDAGGRVMCNARVEGLRHQPGSAGWRLETSAGNLHADVLVNAAGAWADQLAAMAGAAPCGLQPLRRTVVLLSPPAPFDPMWRFVHTITGTLYFKPYQGNLLISPADEQPSAPCDAQPQAEDIQQTLERFDQVATRQGGAVVGQWAGLRSFASDRFPIVGYDDDVPDFFWMAGHGGFGMQTAPALSRLAAALLTHQPLPTDLASRDIDPTTFAPHRSRPTERGNPQR